MLKILVKEDFSIYNDFLGKNNGNNIDEVIATLNKYRLNIDKSNYFVKKAECALNTIKNK